MKTNGTVYLDHQATTPLHPHVLAEMNPYHSDAFGNPHSSDHSLGWEAAQAVEKAAERLAQLIGADPDEIIFTSGATEANNMALLGLGRRAVGGRNRILISAIEHKCVIAASRALERHHGFVVEQIPVDHEGLIIMPALEGALGDDVLAVAVMAVNNEIGTIQDIKKISEYARSCGARFHCDAAQAPIGMPAGELAMHADILSLSGHKMYGPKGIGAVFIARHLRNEIEPLIYGGGQQDGLRSGTLPVPLCVGMGAAAKMLADEGAEEKRAELRRKRDSFVKKLHKTQWEVFVNGPQPSVRHPGNANICFVGFSAADILGALQPHLAASTGSACTSGIPEPSHVLRAIGLDAGKAEASVRFSLGFGTSDEDLDDAVSLIGDALSTLSEAQLRSGTS